jgi:hypothetical protein
VFNKSNILGNDVLIYLDYAICPHFTFLSSPKVTYSLCDRGMRLENYFLFSIMCCEQLKSMSHVFSRPLSITYIRREEVDGSVLGLVR